LPALLRDAQVFSIWEGTTNVLSLDALRVAGGGLPALSELLRERCAELVEPRLRETARLAQTAAERAARWLHETASQDGDAVEAGARRFALTLGRALALVLLADHAQWALREQGDRRPLAAALRFAANGVDLMREDVDAALSSVLAKDE
jgi:hypothetical protein